MDLLRSLPLGLYLEKPVTWLHRLDARVKLVWLMSFLVTPLLANAPWRIFLVVFLILVTLAAAIPLRVWRQQMGWLMFFCLIVLLIGAIAPDGLTDTHQPRLPADELAFMQQEAIVPEELDRNPWYDPFGWGLGEDNTNTAEETETAATPTVPDLTELPQPTDYRYIWFDGGPLTITRHSIDLAIRVSTLLFTLIYSTNLYLLTTSPEAITDGLEDLMRPLRWFDLPVTEIALTLTLSLRFLPLVLEEIQNLSRSIQTRAINWKKLGFRGASKIWLIVAERLLENLLLRAAQISSAMEVRGFTSPDRHRVLWHESRLRVADFVAIALLIAFWGARVIWGWEN
ncbi:energy-coupling factor transporter transmembrane component T family protein [Baaleninema sp.]|uniref:energy-coupling factor transporter transmembrane component T family protein n=1 Tax=Baaleninema sp. TaxID=3101197 RepID=UPI003D0409D7